MKILQTLQFFKLGLVWRLGGDIENTGIENIDIENNDLDIVKTPTQPQLNSPLVELDTKKDFADPTNSLQKFNVSNIPAVTDPILMKL